MEKSTDKPKTPESKTVPEISLRCTLSNGVFVEVNRNGVFLSRSYDGLSSPQRIRLDIVDLEQLVSLLEIYKKAVY